jgi:hypothetical protein
MLTILTVSGRHSIPDWSKVDYNDYPALANAQFVAFDVVCFLMRL